MTDTGLLCRFGKQCRAATSEIVDGQTRRTPAAAAGRGLCLTCERFGQTAIAGLPDLYEQLHADIGKDAGRNMSGQPGGGGNAKVDPPTPLRLAVDAWCREIAWVLSVWAEPVAERVAAGRRAVGDPSEPAVSGPAQCSTLLVAHYSVLLALPSQDYLPYVGDGALCEPVTDDGPGAVVQLVGLYERSLRRAGETVRVESRHMPCPPARFGGCGQPGVLVQTIGSDRVRCTRCDWTCHDLEYGKYAIGLRPLAGWEIAGVPG